MKSRANPFGLLTGFLLLVIAYIATFPIERTGMLGLWYSVEPSIIFKPVVWKISPILVITLMLLVTSTLYYLSSAHNIPYKNNFKIVNWAFIFCIIWGYIGTFLAGSGITAEQFGVSRWRSIIYGTIVFFALNFYLDDQKKIKLVFIMVTLTCLTLNTYGLIRYFGFGGVMTESLGKVVFWERSKLEFSCLIITYTMTMLIHGEARIKIEKLLYWYALFSSYFVIFLSARRMPMLLALFSTGTVYLLALKEKKFIRIIKFGLPIFVITLIIGISSYPFIKEKFIDRLATVRAVYDANVKHGSTEGHLEDFRIGWKEVTKNIFNTIFGVGFIWEPTRNGLVSTDDEISFVHNSLLTFWLNFGIVGLVSYLYIHIKTIWFCYKNKGFPKDAYLVVFLVWFINELLAGIFFPPFYIYFKSAAIFFGVLALANSYINLEREPNMSDEDSLR